MDFSNTYVVVTGDTASHMLYDTDMRVLLQKVSDASVTVDDEVVGAIGAGYLLFFCVMRGDTSAQAELLAEKITKLRLFEGESDTIIDREILVVSQCTLAGRTEKGNKPDFTQAAPPDEARQLYAYFIEKLRELGVRNVASGEFGAYMEVTLTNDGPVTLLLER